jgi:hypothetical protein
MKFKKEKQNLSSFIKEFIELLEKHKAIKEEEFRDYQKILNLEREMKSTRRN